MRYRGVAYRAHNPRWSWPPTSGEGAKLHGGRFNRKGIAALYLALDTSTAILEATQGFGNRFPPLTLVSYDVDCEGVLNLTAPSVLKKHKIKLADLGCAWKLLAEAGKQVPSWELADRLMRAEFSGIIVPSFAVGATSNQKNLVLWKWGEARPTKVVAFDPDSRLKP